EGTGSSDLLGQATDELGGVPGEESGLGLKEGEGGQLEGTGSQVPVSIGGNLGEGEELTVASEAASAIPCGEGSLGGPSPEGPYKSTEPAEEGPVDEETASPRSTCVTKVELE